MRKIYCTGCPTCCVLTIIGSGVDMIVEGNSCPKGRDIAAAESENPVRILTTTVRTKFPGIPVLSVRTDGEIPKNKFPAAMHQIIEVIVEDELSCGDIVIENIAETGVNLIVTSGVLTALGAELENRNVELSKRSGGGLNVATDIGFSPGGGLVRNSGLSDSIGTSSADSFIGTAGEAVGVDAAADGDTAKSDVVTDENRAQNAGKDFIDKGRSHIKRR